MNVELPFYQGLCILLYELMSIVSYLLELMR